MKRVSKNYNTKSVSTVLLLFILIPFFKPDIIVSYDTLNIFFCGYLALSLVFILANYIKNNKTSIFFTIYIIYFLITLLSTIINDGNLIKILYDFALNIGIIMIIEIYCRKDKKTLFTVLSIIFYTLTICNTLSWIIFRDGFAQTEYLKTSIYLLGIDNRFAFTYIPGICIIAINDLIKRNKLGISTFIYIIITYSTFIYFWSAGALAAETILIIFIIFMYKKININPKIYFITALITFIGIVIFRIQNILKFLIVNVLHKDLTLSKRTIIWDKIIKTIKENSLIGIGVQKNSYMVNHFTAYHAHSYFLNIFLQSGIVGLFCFITNIYLSFKNLAKYKTQKISKIVSFTIFAMLIMLIADTFDITCNFVLLLSIGYCIKYLINRGETNEQTEENRNSYAI